MSIVFKVLAVLVGLYVLGGILLFIFQRQFIYFPPSHMNSPEGAGVPEIKIQYIASAQGKHTYWLKCPEPGKATVVVFHGNASSRSDLAPIYRDLIDNGYGIIGISYPGYPGGGAFDGMSQKNFMSSAVEQIKQTSWVCDKFEASPLVLYGTSLGAAVASHVAAEMEVDLIILDAPFDSLTNRAQASMKLYPVGLLLRDKWDNIAALNSQSAPLIWIHGTQDTVIPLDFGQNLFDSYDGEKTAHIIEGGGHNDLWFRGGREIVLQELENLNE